MNSPPKIYSFYSDEEIPRVSVRDEVPPAWHDIVDQLIEDLFSAGWDGKLAQIKEKFGVLRFYIGSGTPELHNIIDEAEAKTQQVCVQCGKPATTTTTGWITNVCDEHKE